MTEPSHHAMLRTPTAPTHPTTPTSGSRSAAAQRGAEVRARRAPRPGGAARAPRGRRARRRCPGSGCRSGRSTRRRRSRARANRARRPGGSRAPRSPRRRRVGDRGGEDDHTPRPSEPAPQPRSQTDLRAAACQARPPARPRAPWGRGCVRRVHRPAAGLAGLGPVAWMATVLSRRQRTQVGVDSLDRLGDAVLGAELVDRPAAPRERAVVVEDQIAAAARAPGKGSAARGGSARRCRRRAGRAPSVPAAAPAGTRRRTRARSARRRRGRAGRSCPDLVERRGEEVVGGQGHRAVARLVGRKPWKESATQTVRPAPRQSSVARMSSDAPPRHAPASIRSPPIPSATTDSTHPCRSSRRSRPPS